MSTFTIPPPSISGKRERWRPVAGYEGLYSISDAGRVRSEHRVVTMRNGHQKTVAQRIMNLQFNKEYLQVVLYRDNVGKNMQIHVMVLHAFRGPCPTGMQCAHNDGVPGNCALTNLRWATPKSNMADRIVHGTANRGSRHGMAKLTVEKVMAIRNDKRSPYSVIAADYGIAPAHVSRIKLCRDWSWL